MNITKKKTPLVSVLPLAWELASKGFANERKSYRKKQQWKVVLNTLLNPVFARNWFDLLETAEFNDIFQRRSRLYIKPFRPYISIAWNKNQKIKVIRDTYRFMKMRDNFLPQFLSNDGIIVANFTLANTTDSYKAKLTLGYDEQFRKEGELVLSLNCEQLGGKIFSAAFSFEQKSDNSWVCLVGCIQGDGNANDVKKIQKLMHGIRPNSFIVSAVQIVAKKLACQQILGVGDEIQSYRQKHAIHIQKAHKINFNYNKFWQEVGGINTEDGWFKLPLVPKRKDIQEVKSKKRSMYRKRYLLLDDITMQIHNHLPN
jgi:uncharacterized protein VirK/YbjX